MRGAEGGTAWADAAGRAGRQPVRLARAEGRGRRAAAKLGGDELLDVAEGVEREQVLAGDRDPEDVLGEQYESPSWSGNRCRGRPSGAGRGPGGRSLGRRSRFHVTFDDAEDDRGHGCGVASVPIPTGGPRRWAWRAVGSRFSFFASGAVSAAGRSFRRARFWGIPGARFPVNRDGGQSEIGEVSWGSGRLSEDEQSGAGNPLLGVGRRR